MTNAKTQAELAKSSKGALATFVRQSTTSRDAAKAALVKLGTHTRSGAIADPYK